MDNKRYFSFNSTQTKIIYKFFLDGTEIEKILYKTYANKLSKVKALSKKLYLKQEIVNSSHDMRSSSSIYLSRPKIGN